MLLGCQVEEEFSPIDNSIIAAPVPSKPYVDAGTSDSKDSSVPEYPGSFDQKKPFDKFEMKYQGGPVMTVPSNVYYIWYGNWDNSNTTSILEDFMTNVGDSDWLNINSSYYQIQTFGANGFDFRGNVKPLKHKSFVSTKVNFVNSFYNDYIFGNSLTDKNLIELIKLSQFPLESNGIYFILTSKDVTQTLDIGVYPDEFCVDFCGWHNITEIDGIKIKYSFIGDVDKCPTECYVKQEYLSRKIVSPNKDWSADGMVSVMAHELAEMLTDPDPIKNRAWGDYNGFENADKCAFTYGKLYVTDDNSVANVRIGNRDYLIQQNFVLDDIDGRGHCGLK